MPDLFSDSIDQPDAVAQIYPLLVGPGQIKGRRLRFRQGSEILEVTAPVRYLDKLFAWCQGDLSVAQISALALEAFGDRLFDDFMADLLASGILIDATRAQFVQARAIARSACHVAPGVFPSLSSEPPDSVTPASAMQIPPDWLGRLLARVRTLDLLAQDAVTTAGSVAGSRLYLVLLASGEGGAAGVYRMAHDQTGQPVLQLLPSARLSKVAALVRDPALLRGAQAMLLLGADPGAPVVHQGGSAFSALHLWAGAFMQACLQAARETSLSAVSSELADFDDVAAVLGVAPDTLHPMAGLVFGAGCPGTGLKASWQQDFRWSSERAWPALHVGQMSLGRPGQQKVVIGWGRDSDPALAYDKALAEAVERYAYRQRGLCRQARWDEFDRMCRPERLIRYRAAQYRSADFPFRPFDPAQRYLWSAAVEMDSGLPAWVVADCVFARSAFDPSYQAGMLTAANSSGCASGRSLQQASEAGLFEVLERDAFMRHWLAQRGGKQVRLETLQAPWRARLQYLLRHGGRFWLQVLDLGVVPVWFAFFQDTNKRFTAVAAASGLGGQDPLAALFSEIEAGVLLRRRAALPSGLSPRDIVTPGQHAALYGHPAYYRRADRLRQCSQTIDAEVAMALFPQTLPAVQMALRKAGTCALCVDLTVNDAPCTLDGTPLVSVRILVPDAIPITFGAGRLPLGMLRQHERAAHFPHPFP